MTRNDLRAQRFAKAWFGAWVATLVGFGSVELAAMPAAPIGVQRPGPLLIQESTEPQADVQQPAARSSEPARDQPAPDSFSELHEALAAARERLEELSRAAEAVAALQEQNQQLPAEITAVRAERAQLEAAKQAAEARAAELTEAAEQAKAKSQERDQELVAMRWQNAQLNTSLAQARTTRDEMQAEARQTQGALRTKLEELEAAAEQTAAETARLREQLEASEQQIAAVDSARAEVEALLSEARQRLQRAGQEMARGGEDRAKLEAELVSAKQQLAAAEQERAQIGQRTAALEDERDELRDRLAAVTERLERTQAANGQLEQQVAELRDAAGTATDLAQQNLIAVENRIRELNEALAAIGPAGGPFENLSDDAEAPMLVNLPLERRLHVQGLLADLHSKVDERGLMTTVPGKLLFAVNSDEVQAGAHDRLAKVAELISMYDDRQVLIIGHSDAMGDAAHNRQLSERQAELVKQIFVDYFELAADRLSTEGLGESRPIAANTTLEGRRANRRVEVLILN